jgi:hypothetical protein
MQPVDKNQIRIWVLNPSEDESEHLVNSIAAVSPDIKLRNFLSYKEAFGVIRNLDRNEIPTMIFASCTFPGEGNAVDFLALFNNYYLNIQTDIHIIANNYNVNNMDKVLDNKMVKGWLNKNPSFDVLKEIVTKKL